MAARYGLIPASWQVGWVEGNAKIPEGGSQQWRCKIAKEGRCV